MTSVAPHRRKPLSADALFHLVRRGFASLPDPRLDETEITVSDALRSACALFARKAPSLLAFDKERAEGNLRTMYGSERVPCDTYMRVILAPVSPKVLRPVFKRVFRPLQRDKALEAMAFLDGHYLLALDGTESCSSKTIHWASCLPQVHRHGSMTYYHQRLGAAIIHPDVRAVMPLMPEPIMKHDGTETNACERHAAKRFMAKLRKDHPPLQCIVPAASLRANAPHIETLHAYGLP